MSAGFKGEKEKTMWPELPYGVWKDTKDTLHMWMQIVGKTKLALAPFINQWWEVAFYLTARGMTSGRIPYKNWTFDVDFDFIDHLLSIRTSRGRVRTIELKSKSVADFYDEFFQALSALDIKVAIYPVPVEVQNTIPFKQDRKHNSYDRDYVARWWRIQLQIAAVFDKFRSSFRGKSSPIHFFWGSFDLSGTRFSGKKAKPPEYEGVMGRIMKYAENEENFAFGFWPGDERFEQPAFYAYIYPALKGFEKIDFGGNPASFNETLSEWILPYEAIVKSKTPEKEIMDFLNTTYQASAKLAGWDVESLEGEVPRIKS